MNEHPIENLMITAMDSIKDMIDVNTIIGEPIEANNNIVIIPISKVSFGFAAGGSEFSGETVKEYNRRDRDEEIEYKLPFGGGAGAGVSINPVAFLVVQNDNVKLMPVDHDSCLDKLLDYVPDLMEKLNEIFNKSSEREIPED
jgi:sporulation protein YtfJ